MNGVESSTNAAGMVRAILGRDGALLASRANGIARGSTDPLDVGALASAREAVRQVLCSEGFVEITGPSQENFRAYLNHRPIEMEIEDLKPGLLSDLAAWVESELAGNPEQAWQVQAHVQSEAAVKLLT